MIKIRLICVGKIKENYLVLGIKEYIKRLNGFCNITIEEVKDEQITKNDANAILKESLRILNKITEKEYVILLDIKGETINSEEFAAKIENLVAKGEGNLCFVIGGSLGVCDKMKQRANMSVSFSKLTFPHQLMRLIFLEQLYRCFKINTNQIYHK